MFIGGEKNLLKGLAILVLKFLLKYSERDGNMESVLLKSLTTVIQILLNKT